MPRTTARGLAILAVVLSTAGCGRTAERPQGEASVDGLLTRLVAESGLPLVDLSVPLDRFNQAPAALERLATSLARRVPGIYVLRYYDDTRRSRVHVFDCRPQSVRYITLTSVAAGPLTREASAITGVEFDATTSTLTLLSEAGSVRLSPQDVTPVGA